MKLTVHKLVFALGLLLFPSLTTLKLAAQETPTPKMRRPVSDEINRLLPKWMVFSAEYRARSESTTGIGFASNRDDSYLLNRFRLKLMVQPESWLKFGFEAQDARVWWKNQSPPAAPYQDTIDLRQGYVELGDVEKKSLGLRAGRQELSFGEERIIGISNWVNTSRTFDGFRGTYRKSGYRLDLFAASVVNAKDGQFDESTSGNDIYGAYLGIPNLVPGARIEPYFLWRRSSGQTTETGARGILHFSTLGIHWTGKVNPRWDYGMEVDRQQGSLGTDTVSAWAGHWVVGRSFAKARLTPHITVEYNYASGDGNPKDGRRNGFDLLYPSGHDRFGIADQAGNRNIRNVRAGLELKPSKKWSTVGRYDAWWLADPHDGLYSSGGNLIARVASGAGGRFVGHELDGVVAYNFSRELQMGGGFGHIFPGTFLKHATPGHSYNFPYLTMTVAF